MFKIIVVLSLLSANKVAFEKLPEAVKAAVLKAYPGAKVISSEEEKEEGKVVYEVKFKHGGQVIELSMTVDGQVVAEEKVVKLEQTPELVRKAIAAALPKGARVERVEQVTEAGKVTYEAAVHNADGSRLELVVDGEGGVVTRNEKD